MNQQILEEIREKIDIVELVSNYLELKKAGNYYKGLCPFHQDRNPSFFVSPQKQIFKCFGCNTGGDVITFYMKIEKLTFSEAVKSLCEKLNIDFNFKKSKNNEDFSKIKKILTINRLALNFFKNNLKNKKEVIDYLKSRGLTEETIDFFDLGYAENGSYLRDYLFNLGYNLEDLKEASLINNKNEDKFQKRIIFPLINHQKRLVGFTGRAFPETDYGPKYLNTSENKIFKKSKFLYGLVYSLPEIEKQKEVILVEGQFDFLLAYQNGIKNIVAISGSSFTPDHLNLLKTYTKKFCLAFDNDEAGFQSSWKTALLLFHNNFEVEKIFFENGKDLADFFKNNPNIANLKRMPYLDYLLDYCYLHYNLNELEGKKKTIDLILPLVKKIDNLKKSYYLAKIAKFLGVKENFLWKELENIEYNYHQDEDNKIEDILNLNDRLFNLIERYITFSLILNDQKRIEEIKEYLINYEEKFLTNENYNELLNLRTIYEKEMKINFEEELTFLKKEIQKEFYKKRIDDYRKIINNISDNEILQEVKSLTSKLKEIEKNEK
ncbi:MAG: DNA primase [Patescibacteria group bacterium]|nr:DNA primase [Patescibacteria group bacterium]